MANGYKGEEKGDGEGEAGAGAGRKERERESGGRGEEEVCSRNFSIVLGSVYHYES